MSSLKVKRNDIANDENGIVVAGVRDATYPDRGYPGFVIYGANGSVISSSAPLPVTLATLLAGEPGSGTQLAVDTEGIKATYSSGGFYTPYAAATDIINIAASATKLTRVLRVEVSVVATVAGIINVQLIKRSTLNTLGTPTNPNKVPHQSTDAAASAIVTTYGAAPGALGTLTGVIRADEDGISAANASDIEAWDFTTRNGKGIVLPAGGTENLSVNLNGLALIAGEVIAWSIEWSEE